MAEATRDESVQLSPVERLSSLKEDPRFWFLEDQALEKTQKNFESYDFELGGKKFSFSAETLASEPGGKLNEDAFLALPFGDGRKLFAILDGVTSQITLEAFRKPRLGGGYYASHLVLGFEKTEEYEKLIKRNNLSASDIMREINGWIGKELQKIEGVDYKNAPTIPGMAATFMLLDTKESQITFAHVADTAAVIGDRDGQMTTITPNQNERFDKEYMEYAKKLAEENKCILRDIKQIPPLEQKLKDFSRGLFKRKINTSNGCGILNGMPELIENNLIFEYKLKLTPNIKSVCLATDGAFLPYSPAHLSYEESAAQLAGIAIENSKQPILEKGATILLNDPDFIKIPRLKLRDDAALIQIVF
jgi:serine/threonine protein phosphatase PrpC